MTTVQAIRNRINEIGMGEPFTSTQFNALGTRAALDQTLSRFVKQGEIARISRGVFVRPKKSRYVGEVLPEPSKVAQAIASVHGVRRAPVGRSPSRFARGRRTFRLRAFSAQARVPPVGTTLLHCAAPDTSCG